jgi:hypothetical protein
MFNAASLRTVAPRVGLSWALGAMLATAGCTGPKSDTSGGGGTGTTGGETGASTSSGTATGGDPSCFDVAPTVQVGTGEREFETLDSGEQVVMVHGPQGGWHMLGSMLANNMTEIVSAHFTITHLATGVVVADNTYRVATVYDGDNCSGYYPGMYGYLYVEELAEGEADTPPELMAYADVEFCMVVTD